MCYRLVDEPVFIVVFWLSFLVQGGSNSFDESQQHRHRQAADLLQHCAAARNGDAGPVKTSRFSSKKDAVHTDME
jgi:hypothetical protein